MGQRFSARSNWAAACRGWPSSSSVSAVELRGRLEGLRQAERRRKLPLQPAGFGEQRALLGRPPLACARSAKLVRHHRDVEARLPAACAPGELGEGKGGAARSRRATALMPIATARRWGRSCAAGQLVEGPRLDHVARAHVGESAFNRGRRRPRTADCIVQSVDGPSRSAQLKKLVEEPGQTVIVLHGDGECLAFDPCIRSEERGLVGGSRIMPHAELDKDVRGHVQGVARCGATFA